MKKEEEEEELKPFFHLIQIYFHNLTSGIYLKHLLKLAPIFNGTS